VSGLGLRSSAVRRDAEDTDAIATELGENRGGDKTTEDRRGFVEHDDRREPRSLGGQEADKAGNVGAVLVAAIAVPVFPATVKPWTRAAVPVPDFTTCSNMPVSSLAVAEVTMRRLDAGGVSCTRPCGSTTCLTRLGETYTPSLAMVL